MVTHDIDPWYLNFFTVLRLHVVRFDNGEAKLTSGKALALLDVFLQENEMAS
jgi:hypothetical protein